MPDMPKNQQNQNASMAKNAGIFLKILIIDVENNKPF